MEIPLEILSDEKGYYDRQCPNHECEYIFKIYMEDWIEKVKDEKVFCPMCGHIAPSDEWYTDDQLEGIQKMAENWAMSYIQGELNKTFKKLSRSTRNNRFVKIAYKPTRKITFQNNPIGQREEWEVEIKCESCGTRTSVIGSAYFCPCCGNNAAEKVFDESLDTIQKMIESKQAMLTMFSELYGKDKAETMCRSMFEGSLGDIVSAFQKFAEARFTKISTKKVRVNDFQIVEKGSSLFDDNCGSGYGTWLSDEELNFMNLMFQRRHILEHNNGIIDERYIKQSHDLNYNVGQRLVLKEKEVVQLLGVIKKLGEGLKGI
jgi:Zn finger protein HypA/HybF involved in hydrogenase expression